MLQTAPRRSRADQRRNLPAVVGDMGLDEASPFGLQGLQRENLQILKADCIGRLAVALALGGTRKQIRDDQFVAKILERQPEWTEEYRIVHLIERSLWISGHSDLVMTLTRNPSQIPDNPPRQIRDTLTRAYQLHPESTIWYGVPLFGDETNAEGLPIPLTAAQLRQEAQRRIAAARQPALRWGWLYRSALSAAYVPGVCWRAGQRGCQRLQQAAHACHEHYRRARRDARRRTRAAVRAQMEYCHTGRSRTTIPEHTTSLGWTAARTIEAIFFAQALMGYTAPVTGAAAVPLLLAKIVPLLIVPMTVVAADPFLFLELPDEPGKLRHLGHWYWQAQADGQQKLHVHA